MLPQKHCNINLTDPIPRWDEAIPLGNGILGSLFWGPMEHLRISVDIAGLWLRRRPEEELDKEFTYAKLVELARKGDVAETEEFCVSIMLSLLILLLGTEVFSRFLLSKSFSWIEELCRYLFVWASYLGVAIAVKRKEQLRVLMLMDTLEKHFPRLVKVCYVVSELSFAVFCVLVFYYSINMLENMTRFKQVSASLEINVMYAYLIIPISMAVTTFRVLQGLYRDFRNCDL